MGLLKDRTRFSNKGLGTLEVREVSPTSDAAYQNLGYLAETVISDISEMEEIPDETGSIQNAIERTRAARLTSRLLQVSIDEMSYITGAAAKYHSLRYSGMSNENLFQFFSMEQGKIIRKLDRPFTNQKQNIPFEFLALKQEPTTFTTPEYHMAEAKGRIRTENLQLWINPRWLATPERTTAKVFDISGFARHGTLNSDFASIWQVGTPECFLRFDGVNDNCDFGNILVQNSTDDFISEAWIRVQAADGSTVSLLGNKTSNGSVTAGWSIYRNSSNGLTFNLGDGVAQASPGGGSILQNVWKHVAVAVDRNGNAFVFVNGVQVTSGSVAAIGDSSTVNSFYIGRSPSGSYGNIDCGGVRHYKFVAGALPADYASIILNHYNAEKSYYGL